MTLNPQTLEQELKTHHQASYGWAVACCGYDRDKAQDVLQAAYLKVLDGRAVFKGRSSFRTWLFSVIRNTARDQQRKARLFFLSLSAAENQAGEDESGFEKLSRQEDLDELIQALSRLPLRQKEILHLVFYQELSLQEAGRVLGISTGAAARHYARGKARLKTILGLERGGR